MDVWYHPYSKISSKKQPLELIQCNYERLGIVEYSMDDLEEVANCLRCEESIPKDECWYGCEAGYDLPVALVDQDDSGNHVYHTGYTGCYQRFHRSDLYDLSYA
jgi:hypothetical protein